MKILSADNGPPNKKSKPSVTMETNPLIEWLESWKKEAIEREHQREERQREDLDRKLQTMERLSNERNSILKDILETLRK